MIVRFLCWLCLCLIGLGVHLHAQNRNNVWMVGKNIGIDFNSNPPEIIKKTPLLAKFPQFTTSICDTTGKLLFYTDGDIVWNKSNQKLKRKNGWWPWYEYTVPLLTTMPGNDSLYYLFGVSKYDSTLKVMQLNSKAGEFYYPPGSNYYTYATELTNKASIMVAGTAHCNRKDTWIVAHTGNELKSFLVTAAGINTTPVVSSFSESDLPNRCFTLGNLKFSANGEKMILPMDGLNKVAVYNFNNYTGKFSDPLMLTMPDKFTLGDAEISPNGSKVYVDAFFMDEDYGVEVHWVYQFDLDAGDASAIMQSATTISPYPDREGCGHNCWFVDRSLALAPNGKIYFTIQDITEALNVINEPDQAGFAASFGERKLRSSDPPLCINYNYIRSASFSPANFGIVAKKNNCSFQPVDFSLLYHHIDSVKWNFGDIASGNDNVSTSPTPQHLFPGPGSYNVTAIIYHQCFTDTSHSVITISPDEIVQLPSFLKDTVLCRGDEPTYNVTTPFAKSYFWSDDANRTPLKVIKQQGYYEVRAENNCSLDVKKFTIKYESCDCKLFAPNAFTPNNDGRNDVFKPSVQCFTSNYRLQIFSRLGNVIYSTSNPSQGWDGNMGARQAENGTYVYLIQFYDPGSRTNKHYSGTLMLLR